MTKRILITVSFVAIILSACNLTKKANEKTIYIGAETNPCTAGVMETNCMQVKWTKEQAEWQNFYGNIEGFNYEKGYEYELIINEMKVENPPADASSLKYSLVKQVSKAKVELPIADNSQNSLDWIGTYIGTLPCTDCEGIKTIITLNKDNSYTLSETYLGKNNKPYTTKGTFSWNKEGTKISLTDGTQKQQYQVGENKLIRLDIYGNPIKSQLSDKYVLIKN